MNLTAASFPPVFFSALDIEERSNVVARVWMYYDTRSLDELPLKSFFFKIPEVDER